MFMPVFIEPSSNTENCSIWNILLYGSNRISTHDIIGNRQTVRDFDCSKYYQDRPWIESAIKKYKNNLGDLTQNQINYFEGSANFHDVAYTQIISFNQGHIFDEKTNSWLIIDDETSDSYENMQNTVAPYKITIAEQLLFKLLIYLSNKYYGDYSFTKEKSIRTFNYFEFLGDEFTGYKNASNDPLLNFKDDFYLKINSLVLKEDLIVQVMYNSPRDEQDNMKLKFDILELPKGYGFKYLNYNKDYSVVLGYGQMDTWDDEILKRDISDKYQDFFSLFHGISAKLMLRSGVVLIQNCMILSMIYMINLNFIYLVYVYTMVVLGVLVE